MMKYLKDEIVLLQNISFREEIQQAIDNILDGYNKVYLLAIHQQQYITKKKYEYADNMEKNFKLMDRNKYLEDENKRYKNAHKDSLEYIKILEKEIKCLKKNIR